MLPNEIELVQKCQQGHSDAFGALYDHYVEPIYRFIYYKTHHQATAEDLTSATFLKALENIQKFKADKAPFGAWLYRIARNTVIDHYRQHKTTTDIEDAFDISSSDNVERDVDAQMKLEKVEEFLKTLKPIQREIVMLRVWEDMPYKEIAALTGQSEANCKMIFSRVTDKMQQELLAAMLCLFFNL